MESEILLCECHSTDHQIIMNHDKEDNIVYCHIHLSSRPFFKRVWFGLKYIFGYKCRYGHWDEFIFKIKDADKMQKVADTLKTIQSDKTKHENSN